MSQAIIVCNGAKHLGIKSTVPMVSEFFSGGECKIEPETKHKQQLSGQNAFIIQGFSRPNDHMIELCLMVDAVKRSGGKKVTVIIPYFPYCRMDKIHSSGVPISAKIMCDFLEVAGVDRIVTMDLHAEQIQGFLSNNIEFTHLRMGAYFTAVAKNMFPTFGDDSWKFCAADLGSVKRTKTFALLNDSKQLCNIVKYRNVAQKVDEMILIGDVDEFNVVVFDDMIDTAGSMEEACRLLREKGAKRIIIMATHPVFSEPELVKNRLNDVTVIVTNSFNPMIIPAKTTVMALDRFIQEIIYSITRNLTVEALNKSIPFVPQPIDYKVI